MEQSPLERISRLPGGGEEAKGKILFTHAHRFLKTSLPIRGPVAQLIERVVRNDEVVGLIPIRSTNFVVEAGLGLDEWLRATRARATPGFRVSD